MKKVIKKDGSVVEVQDSYTLKQGEIFDTEIVEEVLEIVRAESQNRPRYKRDAAISDDMVALNPELYVNERGVNYRRAEAWREPEVKTVQAMVDFKLVDMVKADGPRLTLVAVSAMDKQGRNMLDSNYPNLSSKELMFGFRHGNVPKDLQGLFDAVETGDTTHYISFKVERSIEGTTTFLTSDGTMAYHNTTGWRAANIFDVIKRQVFEYGATMPKGDDGGQLGIANKIIAAYMGENKENYSHEKYLAALELVKALR